MYASYYSSAATAIVKQVQRFRWKKTADSESYSSYVRDGCQWVERGGLLPIGTDFGGDRDTPPFHDSALDECVDELVR